MSLINYKYFDATLLYKPNTPIRVDYNNFYRSVSQGVNSSKPEVKEEIPTVNQGDKFKIGSTEVTITDPFGVRNFEGREGQHSTGIDFVTSTGKAVALKDGVIESVKLQGDGSIITPKEGSSAGWYVTVKHNDGTRMQYMHLDPMTNDEMKKLKGVQLKKGDNIWGYNIGSGSMTGKHCKARFYNGSDPLKSYMDPSILFK